MAAVGTSELTYSEYLYSLNNPNAVQYMTNLENLVNSGQISQYEFAQQVEAVTGKAVKPHYAKNGNILGYTLETVETVSKTNPVNSNASTVARGTVAKPISSTINSSGKALIEGLRGVGSKAITGAALVGTAAMCVSAGITLGKTIDSALYNLNPDFWDSNGMGAINPETWRAITAGDDSLGASLLNVLFGFDNDGNGQAYVDERAFAYMAAYMNTKGVFDSGSGYVYDGAYPSGRTYASNNIVPYPDTSICEYYTRNRTYYKTVYGQNVFITYIPRSGSVDAYYDVMVFSDEPFTYISKSWSSGAEPAGTVNNATLNTFTFQGETYQYYFAGQSIFVNTADWSRQYCTINPAPFAFDCSPYGSSNRNDIYILTHLGHLVQPIEGIGDQQGATLPDTTGWDNYANILPSLQQQYPDLWNNAISYPVVQPDGTVRNDTYIPVAMPDFLNRTDTQPVSGDATQANPEISPLTVPKEFIDTLTKILTNPMPKTDEDIDNDNPPENPTDIGDGSTPLPPVPVGSASSLWKIYHPTQAQVDSFGGWLWSSNFIDQILKIFNNPMEAVIGLHKVYATPIDAGTTTIKVGYLDSQVPSAYIEQQYITVSCGSVDLLEQFGNVFDYSPFTSVQLYLPFVGIVPLNVADVMRATISVIYGVDVITGACLAQVEISRDLNSSVLYQYSGNCAVQYPISSGSYMGIVSSIISVAGGVAATVASGGAAAPLALGAAGGLLSAHTNVQHSGSFSGNSGAMGNKTPYLIISRPQTKVSVNAESMQGYPTNAYTTVGECSGYVKASSAHVINVNATDEEISEINNLLLSGIII